MSSLIQVLAKYRSLLLNGTEITLIISVITIVFGMIFGSLMALMKMCRIPPLRWFADVYVAFIRGTPVLVQIFLIFYGLPIMGIHIPAIVVGGNDISRIVSGSIALVINSTAYICEIVRAGIQSIDRGQREAAQALGMSDTRVLWAIILPQAVKNILPALGNEFIMVVKETSLASTFFVGELMTAYLKVKGYTYLTMECLAIVGVLYFALTYILSKILKAFERRMKAHA